GLDRPERRREVDASVHPRGRARAERGAARAPRRRAGGLGATTFVLLRPFDSPREPGAVRTSRGRGGSRRNGRTVAGALRRSCGSTGSDVLRWQPAWV